MTSAIAIVRNLICRMSTARGVTLAARISRLGARNVKTSVSSGVFMNSAHAGATATVITMRAAPTARFTETTAPGMSRSTRRRWIRALENP